jgi:hypothetical protein
VIPRRLLGWVGAVTLGDRPLEALARRLPATAPTPRGEPAEVSRRVARVRRRGHGGPWLPPGVARWLRSPGCRQYAVVLVAALRRAGHPAELVVGAGPRGAHAWTEVAGRAYDLDCPEGIPPEEMARDFPVTTRV